MRFDVTCMLFILFLLMVMTFLGVLVVVMSMIRSGIIMIVVLCFRLLI